MALAQENLRYPVYQFYGPYDGTNAADVMDWFTSLGYTPSISSEDSEGLYFAINPGFPDYFIPVGSVFAQFPGAPSWFEPGSLTLFPVAP